MAPAIGVPGYPADLEPRTVEHEVLHGWDAASDHARPHRPRLHLLDTGHDLNDGIPTVEALFGEHLRRVTVSRNCSPGSRAQPIAAATTTGQARARGRAGQIRLTSVTAYSRAVRGLLRVCAFTPSYP